MLIPVILAGGAGTRLWPVSRASNPKPFMRLYDGETLLRKTYARLNHLNIPEVLTITNKDYVFKCQEEYGKVSIDNRPLNFILEPCGKNTAPAVAFAALYVKQFYGDEAKLLILPADHLISPPQPYKQAIEQAIELANHQKLVTMGIKPQYPETGYGYIEHGEAYATGFLVKRFIEKPAQETAEQFLEQGNFLWNAGSFCFSVKTLIEEFELHAPTLWQLARTCWSETAPANLKKILLDSASFDALPDISIDYALLEKSAHVGVIKAEFDWTDVGSWEAMSKLTPKDAAGNSLSQDIILIDTRNTYIQSENRMVATIGLNNVVIVDTPDALLIADSRRTQEVKTIVSRLKTKEHESYKSHQTMSRPWGSYTVLEESHFYKIKRIMVKPRSTLSLQMHHHRSEHWVVIKGVAKVINGEKEIILHANESTFIPARARHRLENPTTDELVIIEVQTGTYLGEDDIVRFEDKYERI